MKKFLFVLFGGISLGIIVIISINDKPASKIVHCSWGKTNLSIKIDSAVENQKGHAHGTFPVSGKNEYTSKIQVSEKFEINTKNIELVAISNDKNIKYFYFRNYFGNQNDWYVLKLEDKSKILSVKLLDIDYQILNDKTFYFNILDKGRLIILSLLKQMEHDAITETKTNIMSRQFGMLMKINSLAPKKLDSEMYSLFWAMTELPKIKEYLDIIISRVSLKDIDNFGPNGGVAFFMFNLLHNREWLESQSSLKTKYHSEYTEFKKTKSTFTSGELNRLRERVSHLVRIEKLTYADKSIVNLSPQ